jgi:glycosyltransferase involved in cell wall biosynthesis
LHDVGIEAELWAPALDTSTTIDPVVRRLPTAFRFGNAARLKLDWDALHSADLIHLHYPFYGTAGLLLKRAQQLPPMVVTFHMDAHASGWKGFVFSLHRLFFQTRLLLRAKRLFVSSLDYARHSSLKSFLQKYPERIVELPFGLSLSDFQPIAFEERHTSRLLFVGGLDKAHQFKGLSVLLSALSSLPEYICLDVIGDGDLRDTYMEEARRLGLSSRVIFHGRLSWDRLKTFYQKATLFIFPSTSSAEAFGLVAMEAQACGIPVIASDWPGVRTVVKHDETGFLVPAGDATTLTKCINVLMNDMDLRRRFSERARRWVEERFSDQAHLTTLSNAYRDVLK